MPQDNGPFESLNAPVEVAILLDGQPVTLTGPRHSLNAIRCYLETLALEKQRVLCALTVDGRAVNLTQKLMQRGRFSRVEAESVALAESYVLLLQTAQQQAEYARECVETAVTLVLINNRNIARELWWSLAHQLKEPVLTLSLLPDHCCGSAQGGAPLHQLRRWQLEQIAAIIREVDHTSLTGGTIQLSDALEARVLPWLQHLQELIHLWQVTAAAGVRMGLTK
jgi:hypothetical protein